MKSVRLMAAIAALSWCATAATHIQDRLYLNDGTTAWAAGSRIFITGPNYSPTTPSTTQTVTVGNNGAVDFYLVGCNGCMYTANYQRRNASGTVVETFTRRWAVPDTATVLTLDKILDGSADPWGLINPQRISGAGLLAGQMWLWNGSAYVAGYPSESSNAGVADPGANGIMVRSALNTSRVATYADVLALWAGGACVGYLKSDGGCDTPAGGPGGGGTWGSITGTLSNQTDLNTALAGKAATAHAHAQTDITGLTTALNNKLNTSAVGAANGVPPLGADSKIDPVYLPAGSGLTAVVQDNAPQLGGNLDMNGYNVQTVTPTEMARVHGVTAPIQTQIDGKAATGHTHAGTYEPVDATILRQANLAGSGTATTPAHSDHNHTGTYAPVNNAALTGTPTATTATQGDNSTRIATTAYADILAATKQSTSAKDTNGGYVGRDSSGNATIPGKMIADHYESSSASAAAKAALPAGASGWSCDESSTAGVPATGVDYIRCKAGVGLVYSNNGGPETALGGSGAPTDAHYLTTQAESGLSAEANLGALTTGLLKITVAAGVATPSTAAAGTDYAAANAATTVNGQSCALGSTCTVTAAPNAAINLAAAGAGGVTGLLPDGNIASAATWNAKAAGNASTTVNGQTCTLGSTCTVTADPTSAKFKTTKIAAVMVGAENAATALATADMTVHGFAINDANAKTLTEASCVSDAGDQSVTVKIASTTLLTIHCVAPGSYSRSTTDGTTGYIVAASMGSTAVGAGAMLDLSGTTNTTTKSVVLHLYGTVN